MIVCGVTLSLERKMVLESLSVVKNARPQDTLWIQQVRAILFDGCFHYLILLSTLVFADVHPDMKIVRTIAFIVFSTQS
jgi:hypothetical protein